MQSKPIRSLSISINRKRHVENCVKALSCWIVLLSLISGSTAQDITSCSDGQLVFDSLSNGLYRIEWRNDLNTSNNWSSQSPFEIFAATASSTTSAIPMSFRVVWLNPPPYDIHGEVRNGAARISNAQVRLLNGAGVQISNTVSDVNGWYSFSGFSNGNYTVCVDAFSNYFAVSNSIAVENADHTSFIWLPAKISPTFPTNNSVLTDTTPLYQWESHPSVYFWNITVQQLSSASFSMKFWGQPFLGTNEWQQLDPLPNGCLYNWKVEGIYNDLTHGFVPCARFEVPVEFETEE